MWFPALPHQAAWLLECRAADAGTWVMSSEDSLVLRMHVWRIIVWHRALAEGPCCTPRALAPTHEAGNTASHLDAVDEAVH